MRTPAQIADSDNLAQALRTLTHTLKNTVGVVRMAAGTQYVQVPARELIEDAVARLQDLYGAYEKIATRLQSPEEAPAQPGRVTASEDVKRSHAPATSAISTRDYWRPQSPPLPRDTPQATASHASAPR